MNPEMMISQIDNALRDIGLIKHQLDAGEYRSAKLGLKMVITDLEVVEVNVPSLPNKSDTETTSAKPMLPVGCLTNDGKLVTKRSGK